MGRLSILSCMSISPGPPMLRASECVIILPFYQRKHALQALFLKKSTFLFSLTGYAVICVLCPSDSGRSWVPRLSLTPFLKKENCPGTHLSCSTFKRFKQSVTRTPFCLLQLWSLFYFQNLCPRPLPIPRNEVLGLCLFRVTPCDLPVDVLWFKYFYYLLLRSDSHLFFYHRQLGGPVWFSTLFDPFLKLRK